MSAKQKMQMIPIDHIRVINPRLRDKKKFEEIRSNIKNIGLKKPITVRLSEMRDGVQYYDLTCGQGRLEAFAHYQQKKIPALVTDDTQNRSLLKSLAENMARTRYSAREQFSEIQKLKERGYTIQQISQKVDLDLEFTRGVCHLIEHGEEKLLSAVILNKIPISLAIDISRLSDGEIQKVMSDLYTDGKLTGKNVAFAIKLVQHRKINIKNYSTEKDGRKRKMTKEIFQAQFDKQMAELRGQHQQLKMNEHHLSILHGLTRGLFKDEHFVTLLRAEKLNHLPQQLAESVGFHG